MCPLMKAQISNRKVNTMLFDKRCKKPGHLKKITYEFIIRLPKKELRERLKELRCGLHAQDVILITYYTYNISLL